MGHAYQKMGMKKNWCVCWYRQGSKRCVCKIM